MRFFSVFLILTVALFSCRSDDVDNDVLDGEEQVILDDEEQFEKIEGMPRLAIDIISQFDEKYNQNAFFWFATFLSLLKGNSLEYNLDLELLYLDGAFGESDAIKGWVSREEWLDRDYLLELVLRKIEVKNAGQHTEEVHVDVQAKLYQGKRLRSDTVEQGKSHSVVVDIADWVADKLASY